MVSGLPRKNKVPRASNTKEIRLGWKPISPEWASAPGDEDGGDGTDGVDGADAEAEDQDGDGRRRRRIKVRRYVVLLSLFCMTHELIYVNFQTFRLPRRLCLPSSPVSLFLAPLTHHLAGGVVILLFLIRKRLARRISR